METTDNQFYIPVLSIAGSDPSGGAGIQQDIKTCQAFGCFGMAAITALTAQSPTKVSSLLNTSHFLEAQLTALLDEVYPFAVKFGMIPDARSVDIIVKSINRYQLKNLVVDPVIASTSGHVLSSPSAVAAMKSKLFPLATVLTPNIPEAEIITELKIKNLDDAKYAAKYIKETYGCRAVLLKGGHSDTMTDILYSEYGEYLLYPTTKIDTPNTHGTGCRLSTAIACGLAQGKDIADAVKEAKYCLTEDLRLNAGLKFEKTIIQ